jgi:hypothetical protein
VDLADSHGKTFWRVILADLFGGSLWHIYLVGFPQVMKKQAVEQKKEEKKCTISTVKKFDGKLRQPDRM